MPFPIISDVRNQAMQNYANSQPKQLPSYLVYEDGLLKFKEGTTNYQVVQTLRSLGLITEDDYNWFQEWFSESPEGGSDTWMTTGGLDADSQGLSGFDATNRERFRRAFDVLNPAYEAGGFVPPQTYLVQYGLGGVSQPGSSYDGSITTRPVFIGQPPTGGTAEQPYFSAEDILVSATEQPNLYDTYDPYAPYEQTDPYSGDVGLVYPYQPPVGATPPVVYEPTPATPVEPLPGPETPPPSYTPPSYTPPAGGGASGGGGTISEELLGIGGNTETQWNANKDFIISRVNEGTATADQQQWYNDWVSAGMPSTQAEMNAWRRAQAASYLGGQTMSGGAPTTGTPASAPRPENVGGLDLNDPFIRLAADRGVLEAQKPDHLRTLPSPGSSAYNRMSAEQKAAVEAERTRRTNYANWEARNRGSGKTNPYAPSNVRWSSGYEGGYDFQFLQGYNPNAFPDQGDRLGFGHESSAAPEAAPAQAGGGTLSTQQVGSAVPMQAGAQPSRGLFGGPTGIDRAYYADKPYVDTVQEGATAAAERPVVSSNLPLNGISRVTTGRAVDPFAASSNLPLKGISTVTTGRAVDPFAAIAAEKAAEAAQAERAAEAATQRRANALRAQLGFADGGIVSSMQDSPVTGQGIESFLMQYQSPEAVSQERRAAALRRTLKAMQPRPTGQGPMPTMQQGIMPMARR